MQHIGPRPPARIPEEHDGYRLGRALGRVFAVPPPLCPRALEEAGQLESHPGVLSAASVEEALALIDAAEQPMPEPSFPETEEPVGQPVEFAGWLPAFRHAGNCGTHPQFTHTKRPPPGYHFTCSDKRPRKPAPSGPGLLARLGGMLSRGLGAVGAALQPLRALFRSAPGAGLSGRCRVLAAMARLYLRCRAAGAGMGATLRFLRSRHFHSQLLLANHPGPVFLTSMPFTYGQWPWLVEVEDPTTLFFPFVHNGHTSEIDLRSSPFFPAVQALLEAPECLGVVTHMRSTAELLDALFQSRVISEKVTYGPLGVELPEKYQRHEPRPDGAPIDLLFINSWHQMPGNFFLRGGLDVLEAFARLRTRYPSLRLTMRTSLPPLARRYREMIASGWVRVIDRFLSTEEMAELHASSHVFLLPAARIHVVSLLQAMGHGLAVVASDGWGISEYLEDGRNGLAVRGRYGKVSWADHEAGMLREDYEPMYLPDPQVVDGIVTAVTRLAESRDLRARLGHAARRDVAERFHLGQWNETLGRALGGRATPGADAPGSPGHSLRRVMPPSRLSHAHRA
jgi:glycosyltransferase involved in cell wall biosynthesis